MRGSVTPGAGILAAILSLGCYRSGETPESSVVPEVREEQGFTGPRVVRQNPSGVPLSLEESLASFRLPAGYRLELVASDPMVNEPVAITGTATAGCTWPRWSLHDVADVAAFLLTW